MCDVSLIVHAITFAGTRGNCMVTMVNTVQPVYNGHGQKDQKLVSKTNYRLWLNAGRKYCIMLQGEHSEILLTCIKLPIFIKILVLSIFDLPF